MGKNEMETGDWDAWVPEILGADWAEGKFTDMRENFARKAPRGSEKGAPLSVKDEYAQGAAINLKNFGNNR